MTKIVRWTKTPNLKQLYVNESKIIQIITNEKNKQKTENKTNEKWDHCLYYKLLIRALYLVCIILN